MVTGVLRRAALARRRREDGGMEAHEVFDATDAELEAELGVARAEGRVRVADLIEQELNERGLSLRMQAALEETLQALEAAPAPEPAHHQGDADEGESEASKVESEVSKVEDVLAMLGVTPVASEDLPEWFLKRPGWRPKRGRGAAGPRRVRTEVEEQQAREAKARKWLRRRKADDGGVAEAERQRRAASNVKELNARARTLVVTRTQKKRKEEEGKEEEEKREGVSVAVDEEKEEEEAQGVVAEQEEEVHEGVQVRELEAERGDEGGASDEVAVVQVDDGEQEQDEHDKDENEDEDEDEGEDEGEGEEDDDDDDEVVVVVDGGERDPSGRVVDASGYQVMDWMSDSEGSDVEVSGTTSEITGRVSFWAPEPQGGEAAAAAVQEDDDDAHEEDDMVDEEEEEDEEDEDEDEEEEEEEVLWVERAKVRAEEEREERERESREALEAALRPSSPPAAWDDDGDDGTALLLSQQQQPRPPPPRPPQPPRPRPEAHKVPKTKPAVGRGRPGTAGRGRRRVGGGFASVDDAFAVLRYGSPDGKATGGVVGGVGAATREPSDGDRHMAYRAMVSRLEAWLASDERAVEYEMEMELDAAARYYRISGSHAEVYELVTGVLNGMDGSEGGGKAGGAWREDNSPPQECTLWNVLWTWSKPKVKRSELLTWQRVNHFSGAAQLTRKDLLKGHLARRERRTKGDKVMADTFLLPMEYMAFVEAFTRGREEAEAEAEALAERGEGGTGRLRNAWILKPVHESRGRGISLLADMGGLSYGDLSVVQRYIGDPMLVGGHKFDLRLYVLVNSFSPLEAYVHTQGFARFAAERYDPGPEALGNLRMHLTNTAVQAGASCAALEGAPGGAKTKCGLDHLGDLLDGQGHDFWGVLWPRAKAVVLESLLAVKDAIPAQSSSFELFGYDVLFDASGRAWLIEVNASPSLEMHSALDRDVKPTVVRDTLRIVAPPAFDRAELLRVLRRKAGINSSRAGGRHSAWATASARPEDSAAQAEEDLAAILKGGAPRRPGHAPAELYGWECIASTNKAGAQRA